MIFSAPGNKRSAGNTEKHLLEMLPVLNSGLKQTKANQVFYTVALFINIFAIIYSAGFEMPYGLGIFLVLVRFLLTVACGYFFWIAVVLSNFELNGIIAAQKNVNNLLKSNPSLPPNL